MTTLPTPHAVPDVLRTVGRSPLVRLRAFEWVGGPRLYAKCEFLGAGNAIFDRAAAAEFLVAERAGHLGPGRTLLAAGGTDAVHSLAMAASATGTPLRLLVPRGLMPERRRALLDYGAALENLDDGLGHAAAQELAFERALAENGLFVDLFAGAVVTRAYEAVGQEIVGALGGAPVLTVCGLDLGAIPTGIVRGLAGGALVAVEPAAARIGSGGSFGPHLQLGLAPGPEATALDRAAVHAFEAVDDAEAWRVSEALAARTGLLAGLASGAVFAATLRRARAFGSDAAVVAVLPDSAERRFMLADFFA